MDSGALISEYSIASKYTIILAEIPESFRKDCEMAAYGQEFCLDFPHTGST
jgi:hypothetical protein